MTTLNTLGDRPAIDTPEALLQRLIGHDWTAAMSDDARYWRASERDWEEIQRAADELGLTPVLRWCSLLRGATFWGPAVQKVLDAALAADPDDFKKKYAAQHFAWFMTSEDRPA